MMKEMGKFGGSEQSMQCANSVETNRRWLHTISPNNKYNERSMGGWGYVWGSYALGGVVGIFNIRPPWRDSVISILTRGRGCAAEIFFNQWYIMNTRQWHVSNVSMDIVQSM
jgi:hypothetical protein